MGSRFINSNFISSEQDDSENSPENSSGDSPRSAVMLNYDSKMTCTSSPKRSRRSIQKRVVSVPIKDVEGSRLKGEMGAPPSDSWAWRKYGQKPIKGSPYPRGYYRCSSSKGCPARKQVERSRLDPSMLVITYSCDHNHPWPTPRNSHNHHHHHQNHHGAAAAAASTSNTTASRRKINNAIRAEPAISEEEDEEQEQEQDQKPTLTNVAASQAEPINNTTTTTTTDDDDQKFSNLGETTLGEYGCNWFSDLECTSSTTTTTMLESTLLMSTDLLQDRVTDHADDMAMVFTMRDGDEGDESFFADLGLLPECSTVFRRRGMMEREEHHQYQYQFHRQNLAPWCGTT